MNKEVPAYMYTHIHIALLAFSGQPRILQSDLMATLYRNENF